MAESITQFELQNDETSDPNKEQDDQTFTRRKGGGDGELNKSICIACLHSFIHPSIRCIVLTRIGMDWVGLNWAGVECKRTSSPSSVRSTTDRGPRRSSTGGRFFLTPSKVPW